MIAARSSTQRVMNTTSKSDFSSLKARAWLLALSASGILTLLAGCATSQASLVGKDGRPVGGVVLRLDAHAQTYQFGAVRFIIDETDKVDADTHEPPIARALRDGSHRIDAEVEYVGRATAAEPLTSVRVERSAHFMVAPGCRADIAVVLGGGSSPAQPEIRLDVRDCEQHDVRSDARMALTAALAE